MCSGSVHAASLLVEIIFYRVALSEPRDTCSGVHLSRSANTASVLILLIPLLMFKKRALQLMFEGLGGAVYIYTGIYCSQISFF